MDLIALGLKKLIWRRQSPTIMVVTDRYPPNSVGGAELSLHVAVRAMKRRDLLVVTFGDRTILPRRYSFEGVDVIELPRQDAWPRQHIGAAWPSWKADIALVQSKHTDEARRLQLAKPQGGAILDHLEYSDSLSTRLLSQLFTELRPSLIHADNYRSILLTASSRRHRQTKTVATVRDNRFACVRYDQGFRVGERRCGNCDLACAAVDLPKDAELQRSVLEQVSRFRGQCLRSMDQVIVTSQFLGRSLEGAVDPKRIARIPNAVEDIEMIDQWQQGVAEWSGTNILVVGMLNENKGQLDLVQLLDAISGRVPDATLHLAGRGDRIAARIRSIAAERSLEARIVFHGHLEREHLYQLYSRCQIVALPTVWPEPFGRVPLEAGVSRRPVVAYAVGGLSESIIDGRTGILVAPDDRIGFVKGIEQLARSPQLRGEMGALAREHVLRNFSVEQMRNLLREKWEQLLAHG